MSRPKKAHVVFTTRMAADVFEAFTAVSEDSGLTKTRIAEEAIKIYVSEYLRKKNIIEEATAKAFKSDISAPSWTDAIGLVSIHGCGAIPKNCIVNNMNLGRWAQTIRKYYNSGDRLLTPDRINQLKVLGFVFDILEYEWNKRFELYKACVNEKGAFGITRRTVFQGDNIGAWLQTQRMNYARGKLSTERIEKLISFNPMIFN